MKNYYSDKVRKFTILNLEIRKLDVLDKIILSLFALGDLFYFLIENYVIVTIIINLTILYLIFSTPFGLRFRNIYFSCCWLVLSSLFLIKNYEISQFPLLAFITYHLTRIFFWSKYKKEFIPSDVIRGKFIRYVSKIEGRGGYAEDKQFMRVLFWTGWVLFMYSFYTLIGWKITL